MFKSKLCGFAIASIIGCTSISPISVYAAETKSITLSENSREQKESSTDFEKMMQEAYEKWNTLSEKQKTEVYNLLEKEMKAEFKLMDKLVNLEVFRKEDASVLKTRMQEKMDELRKTGEFPLARPKRIKK